MELLAVVTLCAEALISIQDAKRKISSLFIILKSTDNGQQSMVWVF
jgi:hypothetical protein